MTETSVSDRIRLNELRELTTTYARQWTDSPMDPSVVLALVEAVEAAADPLVGTWTRDGDAATRRLNDKLARFDFGADG